MPNCLKKIIIYFIAIWLSPFLCLALTLDELFADVLVFFNDYDNNPEATPPTTPLHTAVASGNVEFARFCLIHLNRVLNVQDEAGQTPLHIAARLGNVPMITFLLDQGAAIDIRDRAGNTPFHIAARQDHLDAVRVLVARGADFMQDNGIGELVPLAALNNGNTALLDSIFPPRRSAWIPDFSDCSNL